MGPDGLEVPVAQEVAAGEPEAFVEKLRRVATFQDRVEEPAVEVSVEPAGGGNVLGARRHRGHRGEVERDPHLGLGSRRLGHHPGGEAVPEQEMVRSLHRRAEIPDPGASLPLA